MLRAPKVTIRITPRQAEILALRGAGYSNQEISRTLVISINTVKRHLTAAYATLGAVNCAHAISLAVQRGWLVVDKSENS